MAEKPPKLTPEQQAELRRWRVRNYRVKHAQDFACAECGKQGGVVVVRVDVGEDDASFSTRCSRCLGDLEPTPGQVANLTEGA